MDSSPVNEQKSTGGYSFWHSFFRAGRRHRFFLRECPQWHNGYGKNRTRSFPLHKDIYDQSPAQGPDKKEDRAVTGESGVLKWLNGSCTAGMRSRGMV